MPRFLRFLATWLWSLPWMHPKFSGKGRQGLKSYWYSFYPCFNVFIVSCFPINAPKILRERETRFKRCWYTFFHVLISLLPLVFQWMAPNFYWKRREEQEGVYLLFSMLVYIQSLILVYLFWIALNEYLILDLQGLIHSIFSTLLLFTLTNYFILSIQNVLSILSCCCCYVFSDLLILIHSIFTTLQSYTVNSTAFFPF